ncbi:FAD-dependent oxidoreductase [Rhodococcus sp. NPDC056960]|uniref:FAD-dependent oxidoreductase n=1 Tax=Rhodococcus sp. NPDC056960 TaxID=3345982 RepID=UPI0036330421
MSEVTIVGAGICGLTLAIAVTAHGHDATVYERRDRRSGAEDGAYLTVSGRALADLEKLGIGPRLRSTGIPVHAIAMTADGHTRRGTLPPTEGIGHHHVWRRDLLTALQERCREVGVSIVHDAHATAVQTLPSTVRLHLGDGRVVDSDVLVGCDGLSSAVRRDIVTGPTAPVYEGQVVLYGHHRGPSDRQELEPGVLSFFRHEAHTVGVLNGGGEGIFWFARLTRPALRPADVGLHSSRDWKDELTAAFPATIIDVRALVEDTPMLFGCNAERVPELPHWGGRRAMILGDAAHGMSPAAGQGATLAIADALTAAPLLDPATPTAKFISAIAERRTAAADARRTPPARSSSTRVRRSP